jgi:hypothetical protein
MGLAIRITDQIKSAFYAKFDLKEYFLAVFQIDFIGRKALLFKRFSACTSSFQPLVYRISNIRQSNFKLIKPLVFIAFGNSPC